MIQEINIANEGLNTNTNISNANTLTTLANLRKDLLSIILDYVDAFEIISLSQVTKKLKSLGQEKHRFKSFLDLEKRFTQCNYLKMEYIKNLRALNKFYENIHDLPMLNVFEDGISMLLNKYILNQMNYLDINSESGKINYYLLKAICYNKSIKRLTIKFSSLNEYIYPEKFLSILSEMIKKNKGIEKLSLTIYNFEPICSILEKNLIFNNGIKNIFFNFNIKDLSGFEEKYNSLCQIIIDKKIDLDLHFQFKENEFSHLSNFFQNNRVKILNDTYMSHLNPRMENYENLFKYQKVLYENKSFSNLEELTIHFHCNDVLCSKLGQALPYMISLKLLDISNSSIKNGLAFICLGLLNLEKNKKEQNLNHSLPFFDLIIKNNQSVFVPKSIEFLCKMITKTTMISTIDLSETFLLKPDIESILSSIESNESIKEIKLFKKYIYNSENFPKDWSFLKNNKFLQIIQLVNVGLDDKNLIRLSEGLKYSEHVSHLNISANNFSQEGFMSLSICLKENTSIKHLDLSNNIISEESMKSFTKVFPWRNNKLKSLNFSNTDLTDKSVKRFCDSIFYAEKGKIYNELENINFSKNSAMTSDGLNSIISLIYNQCLKKLKELDISSIIMKERTQKLFTKCISMDHSIEKLSYFKIEFISKKY
jgi:hypothetical protein